jgi:hypothetical protein
MTQGSSDPLPASRETEPVQRRAAWATTTDGVDRASHGSWAEAYERARRDRLAGAGVTEMLVDERDGKGWTLYAVVDHKPHMKVDLP